MEGSKMIPPPTTTTTNNQHYYNQNNPIESGVKRYKYFWRVLLIFNFALGAYIFAQPGKKERVKEKIEPSVAPVAATPPPQEEKEEPILFSPPITRPVIIRQPVPDDQQREIFKWMLEEKRKVKPLTKEEKKHIDEEKAVLKDFIRAETLPRI